MMLIQKNIIFTPENERGLTQIYEDHKSWKDPLSRWIFRVICAENKSLEQKIITLKNEVLVDPFSPGKASLRDPLLEGEDRFGMWERLHMQTYIECFLAVQHPSDGKVPSPYDGKPLCLESSVLHAPARAALVWLQKTAPCMDIVLVEPLLDQSQGNELCVRESTLVTKFLLFSYAQTIGRDIQKQQLRERNWDAEDKAHQLENIADLERRQAEEMAKMSEIAEQKEAERIEQEFSSVQKKGEETLQIVEERILHFETRVDEEAELSRKAQIRKAEQEEEAKRLEDEAEHLRRARR